MVYSVGRCSPVIVLIIAHRQTRWHAKTCLQLPCPCLALPLHILPCPLCWVLTCPAWSLSAPPFLSLLPSTVTPTLTSPLPQTFLYCPTSPPHIINPPQNTPRPSFTLPTSLCALPQGLSCIVPPRLALSAPPLCPSLPAPPHPASAVPTCHKSSCVSHPPPPTYPPAYPSLAFLKGSAGCHAAGRRSEQGP